jgi:hypothetical protein
VPGRLEVFGQAVGIVRGFMVCLSGLKQLVL